MPEFDWDDANLEHIAKHGFDDFECEELFEDSYLLATAAYNSGSEKRQGFIGKTAGGRISFIVYTVRKGKVRVVSVGDASTAQKRTYRRNR